MDETVREVSLSVLKDLGYVTALTRNLHVGSAMVLVLDNQVGTGEAKFFTRKMPTGLCYVKRRCAMSK